MSARWCAGLLRGQQVGADRVDPRQDAVAQPGAVVARVHERLAGRPRRGRAGSRAARRRPAASARCIGRLGRGRRGLAPGRPARGRAADGAEPVGERAQRLGLQHRGPRRDEARGQLGVGRLQRVVPVAVAVGGQRGARARATPRSGRPPAQVLGRPSAASVGRRRPTKGTPRRAGPRRRWWQVLPDGQQRPEDDVAVRVLLARSGSGGRKSKACGQSPRAFWAREQPQQLPDAPGAPRAVSRPTGPWQTSRVPQPPPVNCSSPRGER